MQEAKFNEEEIQKCVHIATALVLRQKMEELTNSVEEEEEETKKEKVVKTKVFSGSGYKLSSSAPSDDTRTVTIPAITTPVAPPTSKPIEIDHTQPKTQIQFRLPDGSRLIAQFNTTHTINDIRNHLNAVRPLAPLTNYELIIPTPRKVLSNLSATIQQEGLLNATIVQTLK